MPLPQISQCLLYFASYGLGFLKIAGLSIFWPLASMANFHFKKIVEFENLAYFGLISYTPQFLASQL
jgi:hypothetical protein